MIPNIQIIISEAQTKIEMGYGALSCQYHSDRIVRRRLTVAEDEID